MEYPAYRAMMEDGAVDPIEQDEARQQIRQLRSEIKKLGNVNIDAIEESTRLRARNEELIEQVADIDRAHASLRSLIARLDEACKVQFAEAFTRIRDEFGGAQGMFRKLFGGGRAELRLMPMVREVDGQKVQTDIIDPLESGIEVIAKPPGKQPRSISQLSGGEKTMTAVALLMSIFRSRPSCFCVLDEVDAALDDANVERFAHVVRQFTDLSHFIVITHNKRTMRTADRLYGITMQERGVSKRVSVRFDEQGAGGRKQIGTRRRVEVPEPAPAIDEHGDQNRTAQEHPATGVVAPAPAGEGDLPRVVVKPSELLRPASASD